MLKKLLSLILSICIILTLTSSVFAKDNDSLNPQMLNDPLYNGERTIINSQIFKPYESANNSGETIPFLPNDYIPPRYGMIKIVDSTTGDSGIIKCDGKSDKWNTIKYTSIMLLPYIPKVGKYIKTVSAVVEGIAAVYKDIKNFDTSKTTSIYTRYVYRYFYHTGYVWDYNDYWKFMGESTSKYYYSIQTFDCIVSGRFKTATLSLTADEGYEPTKVQQAPHYMKKSELSNIFYELWVFGQSPYYETY